MNLNKIATLIAAAIMSAALSCATEDREAPHPQTPLPLHVSPPPAVMVSVPSEPKDAEKEDRRDGETSTTSEVAAETYEATAYTASCTGCTGITKTGVDVRNNVTHNGKRIVAVDPTVIPLGSTVELRLASGRTIEATAQDVGGAIKGRRLDLLVKDRPTARAFGRQDVEVRVLKTKEGDGD